MNSPILWMFNKCFLHYMLMYAIIYLYYTKFSTSRYTRMHVRGDDKCWFFKKKIASILNGWSQCKHLHVFAIYLVNKYMFKVNNRDASLVLLLLLVGDIHPFTLLLTNWLLHCIKYEFHLISWGGNFVETNSFCRVLPRVALNLHLSDA